MATRGTLYRCHLCSFLFGGDGPQSEGLQSMWTLATEPVGEQKVRNGSVVGLFVAVRDGTSIDIDTPIRFDVLEEDFLLTGGTDDLVVTILGSEALPPEEGFPETQRRVTLTWTIAPGDTPEQAIADFIETYPTDYSDYLLVLQDPVESDTTYLVTWWKAKYAEELTPTAEHYFIVNVAGDLEDQSDAILNVIAGPAPTSIPSGFLDADEEVGEEIGEAADGIDRPGDGDFLLSKPAENAVDEPGFRELAAQVIEESGIVFSVPEESEEAEVDAGAGTTAPAVPSGRTTPPRRVLPITVIEPEPEPEFNAAGENWPFEHFAGAADEDEYPTGPSPFDGMVFSIMADWTTLEGDSAGRKYAVCYDLPRALRCGRTMFGATGFVVIEAPLYVLRKPDDESDRPDRPNFPNGRPAYYVLPLKERLDSSEHEAERAAQGFFSFQTRYNNVTQVFSKKTASVQGMVRFFHSTEDLLWFDIPFLKAELFRQLDQQEVSPEGVPIPDPVQTQQLVAVIFDSIDAVLTSAPDDALKQLLALDKNAFELAGRDRRFSYLNFLIARFPTLGDADIDRVLMEIFKSVDGLAEVVSIRERLGANQMAKLIRNVNSNLWSMLTEIGKKCTKDLPLPGYNLDFWIDLLQLVVTGRTTPLVGTDRVTFVDAGFVFKQEVIDDIKQGTLSLVRFIPNALKDLAHLVSHPKQIVDAIYQLGHLWFMLELARMPPQLFPAPKPGEPRSLTKAREEREKAIAQLKAMWDGALKSFLLGWEAAKVLSAPVSHPLDGVDVRERLLSRIKWTILWEVLSMLIGVGEVKAALNIARVSLEAASIAALAKKLSAGERGLEFFRVFAKTVSRESRLLRVEEDAARALSHLPERSVQEAEKELLAADASAQTFEQLLPKDASKAAKLIGTRQETEAMAVLLRKGGSETIEATEKAFERLRYVANVSEREILELMEALPEGEGARFVAAVNKLSDEALAGTNAYAKAGFFKDMARRPQWAEAILRGDEKAFASMYRHAQGDAKTVDTMLANAKSIGDDVKFNRDAAKAAVKEVEDAAPQRLKSLVEGPNKPPPVDPPPTVLPASGEPLPVNKEVYDLFARTGAGDEIASAERSKKLRELVASGAPREEVVKAALAGDKAAAAKNVEFFSNFDKPLRDAVDQMTTAERGTFRSLVTDLSKDGFEKRSKRFLDRMLKEGKTPDEVQKAEEALKKLNAEFRNRVDGTLTHLTPDEVRTQLGSVKEYQKAGWERAREIKDRIKDYKARSRSSLFSAEDRARAADRVKALEKELNELRSWINDTPARQKELEALAKEVQDSLLLKDRMSWGKLQFKKDGPWFGRGNNALYRYWADMKFRPTGRPPVKSSFEKYVSRRMGQARGYGGELDSAFQVGGQFKVLKAPDRFSRRGLDLVTLRNAVSRRGRYARTLAILDNKSFVSGVVKDVSAMTRNLVFNLREEAAQFRNLAKRFGNRPPELAQAARRMETVAGRIEKIIAGGDPATLSLDQQRQIAAVLEKTNVPLLVTNTGGQVTGLAPELGKHIQFWDLQTVGELPPLPLVPEF